MGCGCAIPSVNFCPFGGAIVNKSNDKWLVGHEMGKKLQGCFYTPATRDSTEAHRTGVKTRRDGFRIQECACHGFAVSGRISLLTHTNNNNNNNRNWYCSAKL
jgi:hypothetical protein